MRVIKTTCPRCGTKSVGCEIAFCRVTQLFPGDQTFANADVVVVCPQCDQSHIIFVILENKYGPRLALGQIELSRNEQGKERYEIAHVAQIPEPHEPEVILGLPASAARAWVSAERAFTDGNWDAAAIQYGKSLDRATKDRLLELKMPDTASQSMQKRIDALHDSGELTTALKDFAHGLRYLRNDATHDDPETDEAAKLLAQEVRELATHLFTLLFTIPFHLRQQREHLARQRGESP